MKHHVLNYLSALCGGTITAKDVLLACLGCAACIFLIAAWWLVVAALHAGTL